MANAKDARTAEAKKFLVLGDTGAGKTTQFLTLPGKKFAYLFDSNAIHSLAGHDVDYEEFLPDRINLSVKSLSKDKGGDKTTNYLNDTYLDWEKDFNKRLDSGFFDAYTAICFDSATTFLDLLMDRTLSINGRAGQWPNQDDYGPQMMGFTSVCRTLTSLGKIIYMTGHMEVKKDELSGRILREPMMTGRLKKKIPLLFSDVYVADVENDGRGGVKHRFMTVPDRMTPTVRCSIKGLKPFEDMELDFNKPLEGQGLGGILTRMK